MPALRNADRDVHSDSDPDDALRYLDSTATDVHAHPYRLANPDPAADAGR
jgi:hypothetical protein